VTVFKTTPETGVETRVKTGVETRVKTGESILYLLKETPPTTKE